MQAIMQFCCIGALVTSDVQTVIFKITSRTFQPVRKAVLKFSGQFSSWELRVAHDTVGVLQKGERHTGNIVIGKYLYFSLAQKCVLIFWYKFGRYF